MLYGCCVDTTVQRLLAWRRSKAHDRELQHSPMTRRRRYNVGPATVILGFLLTNGHLVALVVSAVLLFPSQLFVRSLLANEQQWMLERPQQEVLNHGCEKFFKKNWTLPNVQETKAPSRRSEPYAPNSSRKVRGDGGVDLWISLTKQMQQLQQQQLQLVEAAVRHQHKVAEQEERAIESGKSISQIRRRLTNTAKESEAKVLDEKSLDFADDETKKSLSGCPQAGACGGQAGGRNR